MVQAARPIDSDIRHSLIDLSRRQQTRTCVLSAIIVHVAKDGTIVSNVESREDRVVMSNVLWCNSVKQFVNLNSQQFVSI